MNEQKGFRRELNTLRFVWKAAKGEHAKMILVLIMNVITGLLPAVVAYFIKYYADRYSIDFSGLLNTKELVFFFGILICGIYFRSVSTFIMGNSIPKIKRNIEVCCIKKFSNLPFEYIADCIDNSIIMTVSMESRLISDLIPMVYRSFIRASVTIVGFVVLLMFISPLLTQICLILISTIVAGTLLFRKKIKQLNRDNYNRIGDLHQYFAEWLNGYKIFITAAAVKYIEGKIIGLSDEISLLSRKIVKVNTFQSLIIESITVIVTIIFIVIATGNGFSGNGMNVVELMLFPASILYIRNEVLNIVYGYTRLAGTESAAKRIIDIIEYPVGDSCCEKSFDEPLRTLTFKDVCFSYPNASEPILKKANISFQRGQMNVIAGRSGAGKSTFINLCMGLRKPQKGAVFYNDKDISAVSEQSLMDAMGLVEQEPFIFDGLIAENIFFDKKPDIKYALELFQKFGLSYLVANENDLYHIKLGKNGRELSVGEKQRLALIRALVKKSEIICFDEVTSNLDRKNALQIIDCIKNTAKEKLVICVTHDEILIQQADALYEIGDGEITAIDPKDDFRKEYATAITGDELR